MSDRDQERRDEEEPVRQALEQALEPTKDMPSQLESDMAESRDPALGTARNADGPARDAPSAGEPGDPRR
jgi:hypothetical protein